MDEDQRPKGKTVHEIGQLLDDLSAHELEERVALLATEIKRLQTAKCLKLQALDAAASIFGKQAE